MDSVDSRVVRIPVAGPSPFNTLVNVHHVGSGMGTVVRQVSASKALITFKTNFLLIGFDPRRPPPDPYPYHSTIVVLRTLLLTNDTSFTMAVDAVSAKFADDGHWTVIADTTTSIPNNSWTNRSALLEPVLSSWVLCYEPPPPPPPPGIRLVGSLAEAFGDIGAR